MQELNEHLLFFSEEKVKRLLNSRTGEVKFGEQIEIASDLDSLEYTKAKYVLFGVPEDIGIRCNLGKAGAADAWDSFLNSFLNIQQNQYNHPADCLLLGELKCENWMQKAENIFSSEDNAAEKAAQLVTEIDEAVSAVVERIVLQGKIPVVIGGGHNNSFGNIKGTAEALGRPINVVNIDAHTDLRKTNFRHSGNGFSYAKELGYLRRYAMLGIHKNYTPQYIFDAMKADKTISYTLMEDMLHKSTLEKLVNLKQATDFVNNGFGLEIDCDSITNFSSSAMTPSGFSVNELRSFIYLAKKQDVLYLHLCEAAPQKNRQIGKALAYFVSDFIRREEEQ